MNHITSYPIKIVLGEPIALELPLQGRILGVSTTGAAGVLTVMWHGDGDRMHDYVFRWVSDGCEIPGDNWDLVGQITHEGQPTFLLRQINGY